MNERQLSACDALVLHSRAYRDTSCILTLLVRGHGALRAVARGVRGAALRRAQPQPACLLGVTWSGRSELKTLNSCEVVRTPPRLRGEQWYVLLYLLELLTRLQGQLTGDVDIFDDTLELIAGLGSTESFDAMLRRYEIRLLKALGYGLTFDLESTSGAQVRASAHYRYAAEEGGFVASAAGAFPGTHLLALARLELDDAAVRRSARNILREAFRPLLGGRPLVSRQLFAAGRARGNMVLPEAGG